MSQQQQPQEATLLARLPFEMLYAIVDDLSLSDQKNCTLVCREWRTIFRKILFRVIDTDTRSKFRVFQSILRSEASKDEQIGPYARHLVVRDGYMTTKEMEELKEHCPNLRHLTFYYEDDSQHFRVIKWLRDNKPIRSNRRYFGVPGQILATLPITSLKFQCCKRTRAFDSLDIEDPKIYLSGFTNLHTLSLDNTFKSISMQLFEQIHANCPQLITLRIETYFDWNEGVGEAEEERKLVEDLERQCEPTRLRHLSMKSMGPSGYRLESWLRYIALRHPSLETLEVNIKDGIFTPAGSVGEGSKNVAYLIADRCRQLRRVTFKNVGLGANLLQILSSKASHLRNFTFIEQPLDQSLDTNLLDNIASLSLLSLSLSVREQLTSNTLTLLRACTRLTNMELSNTRSQAKARLSFNDLVSGCPGLRSITLMRFDLTSMSTTDRQEAESIQSSLYSLTLFYCGIDQSVMDYVETQCVGIKELRIHYCNYKAKDGHPVFRIHLPRHHLRKVHVCDPRVTGRIQSSVRLFSLRIGDDLQILSDAPLADNDAVWFSLCRQVIRPSRFYGGGYPSYGCCGKDQSGVEQSVNAFLTPVNCRTIRKPDVIRDIHQKINQLLEKPELSRACLSIRRDEVDPVYTNGQWPDTEKWKPATSIDYFGYGSLRFGSVKSLRVNSVLMVVDGELRDQEFETV